MTTISIRINLIVLLTATLFFVAATCFATDFQRVLDAPGKFHQKRVTLAGLAHVSGDGFFLYQNAGDAANASSASAVFVSGKPDARLYEKVNNRWVRVIGMLDAESHGLLGNAACELEAEKIERLSQPVEADSNIYGVFRNDGSRMLHVTIPAPGGHTDVDLPPGRSTSRAAISKGMLVVRTAAGDLVTKYELDPLREDNRYFDQQKRTYYYRIIGRRVEIVVPKQ